MNSQLQSVTSPLERCAAAVDKTCRQASETFEISPCKKFKEHSQQCNKTTGIMLSLMNEN